MYASVGFPGHVVLIRLDACDPAQSMPLLALCNLIEYFLISMFIKRKKQICVISVQHKERSRNADKLLVNCCVDYCTDEHIT